MSAEEVFSIEQWDFQSESILADLPPEDLTSLTAHQSRQIYKKGEVIFREGAYPSGIFYIISGKAKKFKVDAEGKELIIYVANTGELIGYHSILSEDRYPDSAAALEESVIAFIPKDDFLKVLEESNILSKRLLKTLSHEFAVLANGLTLFAQRSARERLALQLLVLREKYKEGAEPGADTAINLSRNDLASLVGTARENVVRLLTELKEEGILETKGRKIIIQDVKKLAELANYK